MAFINGKETLFSSNVILKGLSDADKAEIAEMVNGGIADIEERVSALEEGAGGGKQYLHNIVMRDPDMGDLPVGHFYSSDSTPITSYSEIPITFTPVRVLDCGFIGGNTFIPTRFSVKSSGSFDLYGYDFAGGNSDYSFAGWQVVDNVTEV